jgi:Protein of unknown function (DUF1638)
MTAAPAARPLVFACGALAGDLRAVLAAGGLTLRVEVVYLPAHLHNRPERLVPELGPRIADARRRGRPVFVAYADCGTGGQLDALLAKFPGVQRLPGAHCYEVFAGSGSMAALNEAEPGTFYLTDFLVKHFDALVWSGLGLDRHPRLRDAYFGHYRRVVYLSQAPNNSLVARAGQAAAQLGLEFEHRPVGRTGLGDPVVAFVSHASRVVA